MSLFGESLVSFYPQRAIGPFTAQVTVEEIASDDLEITQHPIQDGSAITDHAYVKPPSIAISAVFNNSSAPLTETYEKLLALQASREPFDVVTGKRTYESMLFKTLSQTTDQATESVLKFNAEFQQVTIVSVEVVSVPVRSKQADPAKTGATESAGAKQAEAQEEGGSRATSALAILLG